MARTARFEDQEYFIVGPNTRVTYTPPIETSTTTNETTISFINFSKALPVEQPLEPVRTAQLLISSAISKMQEGLRNGNRPSIKIDLKQLNQADDEDIFWIKASLSDQQG